MYLLAVLVAAFLPVSEQTYSANKNNVEKAGSRWTLDSYPNIITNETTCYDPYNPPFDGESTYVCDPDNILNAHAYANLNHKIHTYQSMVMGNCPKRCATSCGEDTPRLNIYVIVMSSFDVHYRKRAMVEITGENFANKYARRLTEQLGCGNVLVVFISAGQRFLSIVGGDETPLCTELPDIVEAYNPVVAADRIGVAAFHIIDQYWKRWSKVGYQITDTCRKERMRILTRNNGLRSAMWAFMGIFAIGLAIYLVFNIYRFQRELARNRALAMRADEIMEVYAVNDSFERSYVNLVDCNDKNMKI